MTSEIDILIKEIVENIKNYKILNDEDEQDFLYIIELLKEIKYFSKKDCKKKGGDNNT